jgi:peptidoglycan/LPS O-acetylase OafA/YrhL
MRCAISLPQRWAQQEYANVADGNYPAIRSPALGCRFGGLAADRPSRHPPTNMAAVLVTAVFLLGLAAALTLLTAREYGRPLVPAWLGLLNLLPTAIGLIAAAHLWRPRSTNRRRGA